MNSITWLQQWYFEQCNDLWEHQYGITIQSLDNPGWLVKIDLTGTAMQGVSMKEIRQLADINHGGIQGKQNWLHCKVEENCFVGAGGPLSLFSICDAFRTWVEERISPLRSELLTYPHRNLAGSITWHSPRLRIACEDPYLGNGFPLC